MTWNLEHNSLDPDEVKIYKFVKKATNPILAKNLTGVMSLHKYLDSNVFGSPEKLRANVLNRGKPLFTKSESEEVFKDHSVQHGGSIIFDNVVESVLRTTADMTPDFIKENVDSIRAILLDPENLIEDPDLRELAGFIFMLMGDRFTDLSIGIQNASGIGGPPGQVVGYLFASCLNALAILSEAGQGNNGKAFVKALPLVPVFGVMLYSTARSVEGRLEELELNKDHFLERMSVIWGPDAADIARDIIDDLMKGVNPLEKDLTERVTGVVSNKLSPYTDLLNNPEALVENAKTAALEQVIGGKRLSSPKPSNSKWRTQRRLRR